MVAQQGELPVELAEFLNAQRMVEYRGIWPIGHTQASVTCSPVVLHNVFAILSGKRMQGKNPFDDLEKELFLKEYRLTEEDLQRTGLEWSELMKIVKFHTTMSSELQTTGAYVSERLQAVPEVHSLKVRIKDPEHLVEKIIRKKIKNPELKIDCNCYEECIADLVGVRALHLFKNDWLAIHKFVMGTWDLDENPIAYVREGDPPELVASFRDMGCNVAEHPFGYRSVHYVIKLNPSKSTRRVELQVRTIFEEGWSEIDHKVRYPRQSDNTHLILFLTMFNRLAGQADEMGTFTKMLAAYVHEQAELVAASGRQIQAKETQLQEAVSRLKISEQEKGSLKKQIADLRTPSLPLSPPSVFPGKFTISENLSALPLLNPGIISMILGTSPRAASCKICIACNSLFVSGENGDRCPSCRVLGEPGR